MKNKKILRAIAFVVTVMMLVGLVPVAFAESTLVADATINIGGSQNVTVDRDDPYYMLKLVVTKKADYVIWSESNGNDPYLELLDEDGYILNYADDRSYTLDFKLIQNLDPDTYFLKVYNNDKARKLTFPVYVAQAVEPKNIEISLWEPVVAVGEADYVHVRYLPGNSYEPEVEFSSSNSSVARVNEDEILALKPGKAIITAKVKEKTSVSASAEITVTGEALAKDNVKQNYLDEENLVDSYVYTASEGGIHVFNVEATEDVLLTCKNMSVNDDESVELDGKDISVSKQVSKNDIIAVTVSRINDDTTYSLEGLKGTDASDVTLYTKSGSTQYSVGEKDHLRIEPSKDDEGYKSVSYTSSDESIAKVNSYGTVEFLKEGNVTITAKAKLYFSYATITKTITLSAVNPPEITVSQPYTGKVHVSSAESIEPGLGYVCFEAPLDGYYQFTITNNKNINFKLSTVDPAMDGENSIVVPGITEGSLVIIKYFSSAMFFDGDVDITVSAKYLRSPTSASIAEGTNITGYAGQTLILNPAFTPDNGYTEGIVEWSGSNEKVAVGPYATSDSAMVDLLDAGTSVVTMKTSEHGEKKSNVTIKAAKTLKPDVVTVSKFNSSLIKDSYILTPDVSGFYDFSFTSSGYIYACVQRKLDKKWLASDENRGNIELSAHLEAGYEYEITIQSEFPKAYDVNVFTTRKSYPTAVFCPTNTLFVKVGDTMSVEQMGIDFAPYNSISELFTSISSSNETIVKTGDVTGDKAITALKEGTAKVKIKTEYGLETEFNVIVAKKDYEPVNGFFLDTKEVTLESGQTKTVKAVVTEDYNGQPVYWGSSDDKVAKVDSNGNITARRAGTAIIYAMCDGKIAECVVTVKALPVTDTTKVFKDVVAGKWYVNAINYSYTNGFIAGMKQNEFGINTPVTRGMFITILARIAGVDTSANNVKTKFTDVASGKYYTAAIKWASEGGIVNGMSATTFEPNTPIQRQQLCVMIVNFAISQNIGFEKREAEINFSDNATIAKWAKDSVVTCQIADIVNGYSEGGKVSFKPKNTATRAEAAQILYKFHSEFVI